MKSLYRSSHRVGYRDDFVVICIESFWPVSSILRIEIPGLVVGVVQMSFETDQYPIHASPATGQNPSPKSRGETFSPQVIRVPFVQKGSYLLTCLSMSTPVLRESNQLKQTFFVYYVTLYASHIKTKGRHLQLYWGKMLFMQSLNFDIKSMRYVGN